MRRIHWLFPIILLFVCFPAGVALVIRNLVLMWRQRGTRRTRGYGLVTAGTVLMIFWGFFTAAAVLLGFSFHRDWNLFESVFSFGCVFGVPGLIMLIAGRVLGRRGGVRYESYLNAVGTKSRISLDDIAKVVGTTKSEAISDLKQMMAEGYFRGCTLDEANNVFITPNEEIFPPFPRPQPTQHYRTKAYRCKNCGATKLVQPGEEAICEYCGSPLE